MSNLIKNWNDRAIRIRSDRYGSLTDMAHATGKRVNNWLLITLITMMQIRCIGFFCTQFWL